MECHRGKSTGPEDSGTASGPSTVPEEGTMCPRHGTSAPHLSDRVRRCPSCLTKRPCSWMAIRDDKERVQPQEICYQEKQPQKVAKSMSALWSQLEDPAEEKGRNATHRNSGGVRAPLYLVPELPQEWKRKGKEEEKENRVASMKEVAFFWSETAL